MSTRSRSRFRPDRGLVARMTFTMFLLGLLYVVVVAALIAYHVSIGFILVVAGGLLFVQYYFSDKMALYGMGGRIVTPEEAPELHGIVDRLCALADMPKPKVAIADTDIPNAFATGRNPSTQWCAPPPASCAGSTPRSSKACSRTSCRTSRTATSP